MNHSRTILLVILALALGLRVWGITFGLPYDFTADELHHIVRALKVGAGEGGPVLRIWHTLGKGGLDYLLFFEYGLLYLLWWALGRVGSPDDFALQYFRDPTAFYLIGRLTIALMGALTTLAVYFAAKRVYGVRIGLVAAFFGATSYLHGVYSHLINVHVAMLLALWAGIAAYLRFERATERGWLVAAGLLVGVATSLAYTAAIGYLLILAALVLWPAQLGERPRHRRIADAALVTAAVGAAVALLAPDLIFGFAQLMRNFSGVLGDASRAAGAGSDLRGAIDTVTILEGHPWTGYLDILIKSHNLPLSVGGLAGASIGVIRRDRWTLLLSGATLFFVLLISASDRSPAERYLMPIAPAVWILCAFAIVTLFEHRPVLRLGVIAAVVSVSLFNLVGQDYLWTCPDTRVLAKRWVEDNIEPGAKILMDGMRFRFVQSPPLAPDEKTVARRLAALADSELTISRRALEVYAAAMETAPGPTYDLYSTVYGLEVEDLDHYVRSCFDFVIISSLNEKRYQSRESRARFPASARFYDEIARDPRFSEVFSVAPARWRRSGPTIRIYRIHSECSETSDTGLGA